MIPYGGLSFSTFETLKIFVLTERLPVLSIKTDLITDEHHKYELTVVGKLICGGLTGAIAQTVTYPLDVVRRHMQLEGMIDDINFKKYLNNFIIQPNGCKKGVFLNYLGHLGYCFKI